MRRRHLLAIGAVAIATVAVAAQRPPKAAAAATGGGAAAPAGGFRFRGITGSEIALDEWRGQPVLVVNTASRCGFTGQYEGLQTVWERYRDRGLVVIGVPSNDFHQELATAEAVRDFCEMNFGIDFPMTAIKRVKGRDAHPFYVWAASAMGLAPRWNFHKYLIDSEGRLAASFPATVAPTDPAMIKAIERVLPTG